MFEDYKVYGPYLRKDGREHVCLVHLETKKRRTVSYPKFLMEKHLGRHLSPEETVDHIDYNFQNNNIENLQILDRRAHPKLDAKKLITQEFHCPYCKTSFSLSGRPLSKAKGNRAAGKSGPFCSRECAGRYSQEIQVGKVTKLPVKLIQSSYTTLKIELLEGDSQVELDENRESLAEIINKEPDAL